MRDGLFVQARDVVGNGLTGLGQHQRTAADDRAQENLQAAIAADVVEGRPDRSRAAGRTVGGDRAGQAFERMADDFRQAQRA